MVGRRFAMLILLTRSSIRPPLAGRYTLSSETRAHSRVKRGLSSGVRVGALPVGVGGGNVAHQVAADGLHLLADSERGGLFEEDPGHAAQRWRDRVHDGEGAFAVNGGAAVAFFEGKDGGEIAERALRFEGRDGCRDGMEVD